MKKSTKESTKDIMINIMAGFITVLALVIPLLFVEVLGVGMSFVFPAITPKDASCIASLVLVAICLITLKKL